MANIWGQQSSGSSGSASSSSTSQLDYDLWRLAGGQSDIVSAKDVIKDSKGGTSPSGEQAKGGSK